MDNKIITNPIKKMKLLDNIKNNKYTTGTGLAMLAILILKGFNVDLGSVVGMDTQTLALNLGTVISSMLLLFSKDPKDKPKGTSINK